MTNIRTLVGETARYSTFNREERNCVAMLYHALLTDQNLAAFMQAVGYTTTFDPQEVEVFVEWSYLRDLWNHTDQQKRREVILESLPLANAQHLTSASPTEFNTYFGATPKPSTMYIQSPATWSIAKFSNTIADSEEFLGACRLKWAFRVKPDLVIQPDADRALCIEAKWESGEGRYPAVASEIAEFTNRDLPRSSQTEIQRYMMEDLLGIETGFRLLTRKPPTTAHVDDTLTWKEAFQALDLSKCPSFLRQWVELL